MYESFKLWVETIKVPLPNIQQQKTWTCGASALKSICDYYGIGPNTEDEYVQIAKTKKINGTQPQHLIAAAKKLGLNAIAKEEMTIKDLKNVLDEEKPVLCLMQAWGDKKNYHKLESGHFVVAIGYDKELIYFEDPWMETTRGHLTCKEFFDRWNDKDTVGGTHYHQYGIVLWMDKKPVKKKVNLKSKEIK